MDNRVFRVRDEVAFRKAEDGTMTIVSPVTDKIITVNPTATEIWEMIDGEKTVSEIISLFEKVHSEDKDFPGQKQIAEDVTVMVDSFFHRELIELSDKKS